MINGRALCRQKMTVYVRGSVVPVLPRPVAYTGRGILFWCVRKAAQAFHNRSPPAPEFDTCQLSNFGGGYEEERFLFIYRRKEGKGQRGGVPGREDSYERLM